MLELLDISPPKPFFHPGDVAAAAAIAGASRRRPRIGEGRPRAGGHHRNGLGTVVALVGSRKGGREDMGGPGDQGGDFERVMTVMNHVKDVLRLF